MELSWSQETEDRSQESEVRTQNTKLQLSRCLMANLENNCRCSRGPRRRSPARHRFNSFPGEPSALQKRPLLPRKEATFSRRSPRKSRRPNENLKLPENCSICFGANCSGTPCVSSLGNRKKGSQNFESFASPLMAEFSSLR